MEENGTTQNPSLGGKGRGNGNSQDTTELRVPRPRGELQPRGANNYYHMTIHAIQNSLAPHICAAHTSRSLEKLTASFTEQSKSK